MKKNQGFSLVELIVVIAIMAVLVGVLAPAYLRYVEKSRKSSDISSISDIIAAGEKVAIDVQFDLPVNTTLTVSVDAGEVTLAIAAGSSSDAASTVDYTGAAKEWREIAGLSETDAADADSVVYTCKSKAFKDTANDVDFVGKIESTGAVTWSTSSTDSEIYTYSPDFRNKWQFSTGD